MIALGSALVVGALPRLLSRQRIRDALWFGTGCCLLASTRPFEGLALVLPAAIVLLVWWIRSADWKGPHPFGVAFDRRGHGRSDDPCRGYDFDTLADDIAAVMDALDLQDVVLVGQHADAALITAATLGKSPGTLASLWTSDAMISTS